jgi:uncharacterized protein
MKYTLLVILFCVFSQFCQGQLLWKITGKHLQKPSYLYGTMHVADARVFVLKDKLIGKIAACEVYAGEMIFDPSMMFAILPQLFMDKDTTLKTLLSEQEYKIVKGVLDEKLGMMSSFSERMKPIFTSLLLQESSGSIENMKNTLSAKQGKPLDLFLQEEASKQKLELVGLETLEEQMNVFNAIPLQKQAKTLYQEIINEEKDTTDVGMERMIGWYAAQQLDSLYQYTVKEFADDPALSYQILTKRNENMAGRIEKLILQKSAFIAIGAAHLPDTQGVIALLRKRKFKIGDYLVVMADYHLPQRIDPAWVYVQTFDHLPVFASFFLKAFFVFFANLDGRLQAIRHKRGSKNQDILFALFD